ncbi:hypothetical protein CALVIDRAFT_243975 [Calocera viscosa TUFC12733]|uniref:Uncharacterized protein n=1 Tax=Calocera viscosa (strain TUFC12733) TaxID=1330018 RepID=A0A167JR61_CALVF|nr:hypothetical protein CALVIDRAFT_243975 [Calocera viscosa TUFC12733]
MRGNYGLLGLSSTPQCFGAECPNMPVLNRTSNPVAFAKCRDGIPTDCRLCYHSDSIEHRMIPTVHKPSRSISLVQSA